ncbi:acyltransferase [Ruminococcus sp.]|uniref:acyltransferase n=1 Tax=Ruminococcus sp. TaxID=41978 RepID=UPI00261B4EDB|nr:acyltransferase [Ruminococcus sp.]MDD7556871.1 acyltransferase [Ruminococcus sp.]
MIHKLKWIFVLILSKFLGEDIKIKYFRKSGIIIGRGCRIYSDIVTSEPYLIEIGENVTISTEVDFVTHDNSIIKVDKNLPNLYGKIRIGNNCFIGARAILMYGVSLSDNIIVAAGSVVTKSISEERVIVGGNPARIIGTWDKFYERNKNKGISRYKIKEIYDQQEERLIRR